MLRSFRDLTRSGTAPNAKKKGGGKEEMERESVYRPNTRTGAGGAGQNLEDLNLALKMEKLKANDLTEEYEDDGRHIPRRLNSRGNGTSSFGARQRASAQNRPGGSHGNTKGGGRPSSSAGSTYVGSSEDMFASFAKFKPVKLASGAPVGSKGTTKHAQGGSEREKLAIGTIYGTYGHPGSVSGQRALNSSAGARPSTGSSQHGGGGRPGSQAGSRKAPVPQQSTRELQRPKTSDMYQDSKSGYGHSSAMTSRTAEGMRPSRGATGQQSFSPTAPVTSAVESAAGGTDEAYSGESSSAVVSSSATTSALQTKWHGASQSGHSDAKAEKLDAQRQPRSSPLHREWETAGGMVSEMVPNIAALGFPSGRGQTSQNSSSSHDDHQQQHHKLLQQDQQDQEQEKEELHHNHHHYHHRQQRQEQKLTEEPQAKSSSSTRKLYKGRSSSEGAADRKIYSSGANDNTPTPEYRKLERPQSRKLYLGSKSRSTSTAKDVEPTHTGRSTGSGTGRPSVPKSAGPTFRRSVQPGDMAASEEAAGTLLRRQSSFGGFESARGTEVDAVGTQEQQLQRPPSRQRSAFPFHLEKSAQNYENMTQVKLDMEIEKEELKQQWAKDEAKAKSKVHSKDKDKDQISSSATDSVSPTIHFRNANEIVSAEIMSTGGSTDHSNEDEAEDDVEDFIRAVDSDSGDDDMSIELGEILKQGAEAGGAMGPVPSKQRRYMGAKKSPELVKAKGSGSGSGGGELLHALSTGRTDSSGDDRSHPHTHESVPGTATDTRSSPSIARNLSALTRGGNMRSQVSRQIYDPKSDGFADLDDGSSSFQIKVTFSDGTGDDDGVEDGTGEGVLVQDEGGKIQLLGTMLYHSLSSPEGSDIGSDIEEVGDVDLYDSERRPHTVAHSGTAADQAWGYSGHDGYGHGELVTSLSGTSICSTGLEAHVPTSPVGSRSDRGAFRRGGRTAAATWTDTLGSDPSAPDFEGSVMVEGSVFSEESFNLNLDSSLGDDFLSLFAQQK